MMAPLRLVIMTTFCCSTFVIGAPDGDVLALDLQKTSLKAVLMGKNAIETLKSMLNDVDKQRDKSGLDPTKVSCPACPELSDNTTCAVCPPEQVGCPEVPNKGTSREANFTCPECPTEVAPVSCPELVTCPECPAEITTVICPETVTCPECPSEVSTVSCPEAITCPAWPDPTTRSDELTSVPVDCYEYRKRGFVKSDIYKIHPLHYSIEGPIEVFCDMETDGGGWTVFQRRGDFGEPKQDFYLNWADYKKGFGELKREFWLGNDYLFVLTNQKRVSLRVDLEDWKGENRYATYEDFLVRSEEDKYRVSFGKYAGNAGDSMRDVNFTNHNMAFSTKDRDNDEWNVRHCAQIFTGSWWFGRCTEANLNGVYLRQDGSVHLLGQGVIWKSWKGLSYSLKGSEMKIRPLLASG